MEGERKHEPTKDKRIYTFKKLEVYRLSLDLAQEIYELTKDFPPEEKYSLIDQIRRSSRSVGAQIAEAWGRRLHRRHFISKLGDADGEQQETQHWIIVGVRCGYLDRNTGTRLINEYGRLGAMLGSMIHAARQFTRQPEKLLKESPAEYYVDDAPDFGGNLDHLY